MAWILNDIYWSRGFRWTSILFRVVLCYMEMGQLLKYDNKFSFAVVVIHNTDWVTWFFCDRSQLLQMHLSLNILEKISSVYQKFQKLVMGVSTIQHTLLCAGNPNTVIIRLLITIFWAKMLIALSITSVVFIFIAILCTTDFDSSFQQRNIYKKIYLVYVPCSFNH